MNRGLYIHNLSIPLLIVCVAILAPPIPLTNTFGLRPEIPLAIVAFCYGFLKRPFRTHADSIAKWFFALAVLISISIFHAEIFLGISTSLSDYFEIFKVGVYYAFYRIGLDHMLDFRQKVTFRKFLIAAFLASAMFAIAQYFNLWNVNDLLTPRYVTTQLANITRAGRVTGTTSNPNDFGFLMLIGFSLMLSFYLRSVKNALGKIFYVCCFLMCGA